MPQLLVLQSWPASNWLLKKNTWTDFVILDLQNYRVTVTLSHCHILLTCSVLDILLAQTQLPTRNSCQLNASAAGVSWGVSAFAFRREQDWRIPNGFHQWFYIKIIKTPMARPKTKRQFGLGWCSRCLGCLQDTLLTFDSLAFKEKTVLANLNSQVTTHEVCCCLQITLFSGVEIWGTKKKHPITCKPFDASAAGASVLACKQLIVEEKRQRHQN